MALLTYQTARIGGTAITFAAASGGGDTVAPRDRGIVLVRNDDAASKTVTVVVPGNTRWGQAEPDVAVTVDAGDTAAIGPFPSELADPSDGLVHLTYSAVTSVTVAAVAV